jgi:hypothetical protein
VSILDVCADFLDSEAEWRDRVEVLRQGILQYDYEYVPNDREGIIRLCDSLISSDEADKVPFSAVDPACTGGLRSGSVSSGTSPR